MTAAEPAPCGCPAGPGRQISDQAKHAAWHALVVEQGGPAGEVSVDTLRAARGFKGETFASETILDVKNRATGRSVSGARRRAARGES